MTNQALLQRLTRASSLLAASVGVLLVLSAAACGHTAGRLEGRASDEWTRSYTVAQGGEVQIVGAAGTIEVVSSDSPTVEVRAERIVHAVNDAVARPMVERIRIAEEVTPDKVVLRNDGLGGIIIGLEIEVNFHVSVPAGTNVRLRSANGDITLADLTGSVVASATNGSIAATRIRGGVDARSVNGNVSVEVAAVGPEPVDLRTVNGSIDLMLPATADASIALNVTNGTFDLGDLPIEQTSEPTRRRVRGRMNAGGTPVELTATNGNVRVRPAP